MQRALTTVLAFYWMTEFAILAGNCVARFDDGLQAALAMLGAQRLPAVCADGGLLGAALFGAILGLVALLFAWALVTGFGRELRAQADDLLTLAFAGGALAVSALTLAGAFLGVTDILASAAVEMLALLASYLVIQSERRPAPVAGRREQASLPRAMAVNAVVQYSAAAAIRTPFRHGRR